MRLHVSFGILVFLLAACGESVEEKAANFQFYEEPDYIALNTDEGYFVNSVSQDSILPIVLFSGDTVISGKPLPAIAKVVHPDSIKAPVRVKAAPPLITPANENIHPVPQNLIHTPLNENARIKIAFGEGTTSEILLNSVGDTITPGVPFFATGTPLPMRIKQRPAAELQMKDAANYDIRFLDVNQGLSSSYLFTMFQDSRGIIWFGTYGQGLACYDGTTITYFSQDEGFPDEEVVSIVEDKNGNIWIGSYGAGLLRYDGQTFTWYDENAGLTGNIALELEIDRYGRIWSGTPGYGVVRFEPDGQGKGGKFTTFTTASGLNSNTVTNVFSDSQGNLWLGTDGGGVGKLEFTEDGHEKEITWYTTACGLPDDNVLHIDEDANGLMWFGGTNGICSFDGKSFTHFTTEQGLSNNRVRSLMVASDSLLWIGTSDGLNRFDGNSFTHYKTSNGLTHNRLSGLIEDNAHNIWMGTWGGGACRFNPHGFANYYEDHGLPSAVLFSILEEPNGNFWFSSLNGIVHYDGNQFVSYNSTHGLMDDYIRSIYLDENGLLWIAGFDHGMSLFDGTSFTHYTPENGLSGQRISTFYKDGKDRMWIGTWDHGITVIDNDTWTHYTTENGLADDQILVIMEDRNGITWIGSDGGGLTRFDGTSFTHFTEREGLPFNSVFSIFEDSNGYLWLGTNGSGVAVFDGKGFTHYGIRQGLVNSKVRSIIEDKEGQVWVGTDGGLTCFVPDPGEKLSNGMPVYTLFNYASKDGLKGIDFNTNSAFIDSKNKAYWGTGKGLVNYDLNYEHITEKVPVTVLHEVGINGQQVNFRDTTDALISTLAITNVVPFENYPAGITLPYTYNHLTFYFSAIDWSAPEKLKYAYRLAGLNDTWSIPSSDAKADYHSLPHGNYTFEVKAFGESQRWGEVTSYSFTILPPWWHTWWFRILAALLIVVIIYLLVRWRTAALVKRQVELEKIVEERTIEVVKEKKAVEDQKSLVEEKNKEILDSIAYAKRLQEAILPSEDFVRKNLPDSFILYKPKDIVAGDFYWMETVGDTILFAVADCTGHGVPGALVSVVCSNALNQAVREFGITEPAEILNKVRDLVIQTFEKSKSEVKDGMDISLFSLTLRSASDGGLSRPTLHWAGANNGLWIIRKNLADDALFSETAISSKDGLFKLKEIKADKQPIGKYHNPKPFTNHSITLEKGDKIYLFSDGFQDQFGGSKSKKFKASRLKELLLELQEKKMNEQCLVLENAFENWRGELEQLDDVCIAGVQV
jgi:ligand-binding sensor domain-containing protein/serine phosphatase RsbU (regulator of sigma subunit)